MEHDFTPKPSTSQTYPPGLYIVATPIGNLRDMTLRALDVLHLCDTILCEDTRVSGKLMAHYGIKTPLLSYHDHNGEARRPQVMEMLAHGKRVALISDAGTPLISDPGYKLVHMVSKAGYYVSVLPGASSVLAALCLSALPCNEFYFAGFLPAKQEAYKEKLSRLAIIPATLVIFESNKRVGETCRELLTYFGDRQVAIARELTKLHEEIKRGSLSELADYYAQRSPPKGEVVMVISPPDKATATHDIPAMLAILLKDHSVKEAAAIVAEQTGKPRKEIYGIALTLKE